VSEFSHGGFVPEKRSVEKARVRVTFEVFPLFQERAVFDSTPTHLLRGNGVVPGQGASQPPVEAFVYQNAHRSDGFENGALACFDDGDGLLAFDRGEGVQKVFDGFSALQVINQVWSGTRVPTKTGVAPMISGSE